MVIDFLIDQVMYVRKRNTDCDVYKVNNILATKEENVISMHDLCFF